MSMKFDSARALRGAVALLALALLAGCGFQLRGSASLPTEMATTWLKPADPTSPFTRELELLLRANGVTLAHHPARAVNFRRRPRAGIRAGVRASLQSPQRRR